METERVSAALRVRTSWEAIDLGFRMARAWWWPLFGSFALFLWPVALAVHVALQGYPFVAALVVWWLKPLYDRVALYVVSEGLFGNVVGIAETLRALPSQLSPGLIAQLTWLRLSPMRAFHLPVYQLERQTGRARGERVRVLTGRDSRAGLGLHIACLHLEFAVWYGLLQFASSFQQPAVRTDLLGLLGLEVLEASLLGNALYVLAISFIEPLYVAAGFALYINRRVFLEGWDIDLVFRKLARRVAALRAPAAGALALLLIVGAAAEGRAQQAAEPVRCAAEAASANACVDRILARDEFATTREWRYWVPKGWEEEPVAADGAGEAWIALIGALAQVLRALGLLAALLVVGWLVLLVWRLQTERDGNAAEEDAPPETRFGLDLRPESLPSDVIAAARAAWSTGDRARALSLLYRGALVYLVRDLGLVLPESATEGECERLARRHAGGEIASDFSALTRAWLYCAYADEPPAPAAFEELLTRWGPHLGAGA